MISSQNTGEETEKQATQMRAENRTKTSRQTDNYLIRLTSNSTKIYIKIQIIIIIIINFAAILFPKNFHPTVNILELVDSDAMTLNSSYVAQLQ